MPARIVPSTSIDSSDLSIYQEFADRAGAADDEIVFSIDKKRTAPRSLTSTIAQTTFQKLYRWLFGQKKSDIVQAFSAALEAKYDKDVASFAFSEDQKQQALNAGLSKRTIKEVIKNANLVQSARDEMKAYVDMAEMNIEIARRVNPQIELTELHQKFRKIKNFATSSLSQFKDMAALQAALQEAITVATTSQEMIHKIAETERNEISGLKTTRLQHQKVMAELTARLQRNPTALEEQLQSLSAMVLESIKQTASQLRVFTQHLRDAPSSYFYLEPDGLVALHSASDADGAPQLTAEENEKIWRLFCNTLEACYGKPLMQRMLREEGRQEFFSSPLTVARVQEFFDDIERALEVDRHFLKHHPLIVDDSYCETLSTHPELLQQALEAEQRADAAGTLSIQIARKLFDVGALSAGYHAGGLVAGGIGTAFFTITGATVPIVPLTFVTSIVCSFVAGRIVGSRVSSDVGSFASYRAATYSVGGNTTEIATQPLIHLFQNYLIACFSHMVIGPQGAEIAALGAHTISFLTRFGFEEGGSIVAENIRAACIGSVVNGVDIAALPARPDEPLPSQAADMDTRLLDLAKTMANAINQFSVPPQPEWERVKIHI